MGEERTPQLTEIIREGVRERLGEMHTCIAAKVTSYDDDDTTVDVKPLFKERFDDDSFEEFPIIQKVPFTFFRFGPFVIKSRPEVGQEVLLHVHERSIDELVTTTRENLEPKDPRRFDLSDAIATPNSISRFSEADGVDEGELKIGVEDGSLTITIHDNGSVEIGDENAGIELLDLLDRSIDEVDDVRSQVDAIADAISRSTVATAAGPQPLVPASAEMAAIRTQLTEIATQLTTIQSELDQIKE